MSNERRLPPPPPKRASQTHASGRPTTRPATNAWGRAETAGEVEKLDQAEPVDAADVEEVPEIDVESFDRVTAIPELPSEVLAKQLMAEALEDPSSRSFDREEVTRARTHTPPKLELDLAALDETVRARDPSLGELAERYAMGDYSGALVVAEGLLENDPGHVEALRFAKNCRETLTNLYSARLGPLDQVVLLGVPGEQLRWLALDHRAGFLLSLVDGVLTIEEILDISGMPRLDALRIMFSLLQEGVITLPSPG